MLFKNATIYTMEQDPFVGDFKIDKGVFTQLKDKLYFKQVKTFFCGIAWPNEQDLRADTIAFELQ